MLLDDDVEPPDLDRAHHEQAEVRHQQLGDLGFGDLGSGDVEAEVADREVAPVAERDDRVDHGAV